jgi:guanine deaminase
MGDNGWLETYTFPAEQRLGHDLEHAKHVYQSLVYTLLNNGTTTAVYFATLHVQPCKILVDTCIQNGQRAFVGKVCMDRNSPANYVQSCEQNIQQTRELIEYIHETCGRERDNTTLPLVLPIITPRFIPTCSTELMSALGDLTAEYQCHVQSHISESLDEVAFSRELDREDNPLSVPRTDAAIFDAHDLLTDRCVMAHGVHLTRTDQKLLKDRGASVAHCPLSNFYFAGGSLPCRKMLENNNKVGLGTDVAGGYSPSMMNSMRMAVIASRSLEHADILTNVASTRPSSSDQHSIDYRHAFYLATLGGAEALGLQDRIGTFAVGMEFDAIVLSAVENSAQLFDTDRTADIFQKLCTLGDDRNIRHDRPPGWTCFDRDRVLVFVSTRYAAEHVARKLRRIGIDRAKLHGKLDQDARVRRLESFRKGRERVLLATDVATVVEGWTSLDYRLLSITTRPDLLQTLFIE